MTSIVGCVRDITGIKGGRILRYLASGNTVGKHDRAWQPGC
jgi:hypothetical protein